MAEEKRCQETRAVHTNIILPKDTNSAGNLYGGQLLYLIDSVSAVSALKLIPGVRGVTASMDNVNFLKPFPEGNSLTIISYVSGIGNTSVEVFVKVIGENLEKQEKYIGATSFITLVYDVPAEEKETFRLPEVVPETLEEKYISAGYQERRKARLESIQIDKDVQQYIIVE